MLNDVPQHIPTQTLSQNRTHSNMQKLYLLELCVFIYLYLTCNGMCRLQNRHLTWIYCIERAQKNDCKRVWTRRVEFKGQ